MRNWIKNSCYVILGLIGFNSTNAEAAVDMVLCINGVAGDPADSKTDTGCIDVLAWNWGASSSSSILGTGKTNFQDISITKYQDTVSTYLLKQMVVSKVLPAMELRVRRACGVQDCVGPMTSKLTFPTSNIVTSYSNGGSGGEDRLTENITIAMASIIWCNYDLDVGGNTVKTACDQWDIAGNDGTP